MDKILEKFKITTENNEEIIVELEMFDSGAFEYGNKHAVSLTQKLEDGNIENIYDVRYDKRFNNEKTFRKHALEFVKENTRSTCKIEHLV